MTYLPIGIGAYLLGSILLALLVGRVIKFGARHPNDRHPNVSL